MRIEKYELLTIAHDEYVFYFIKFCELRKKSNKTRKQKTNY